MSFLLRLRWVAAVALAGATPLLVGCGSEGADTLANGGGGAPVAPKGEEPERPPPPPEGAFPYDSAPTLLPFDVRLEKVARVLDIDPTSPLLQPLRARRLELGDYDYASGVKPDGSWAPSRIGVWVKALKPICASKEMKARYAALPERLDHLILIAYGRDMTEEDKRDVEESLGSALDSESAYLTTCLGVLSSLEFVAR